MQTILPELTDRVKGVLMMDYDQLIPFLVEAVKEQQEQIQVLQTLVYSQEQDLIGMKKQIESCCPSDKNNSKFKKSKAIDTEFREINSGTDDVAQLYDNTPNPFNENTEITFYIPENAQSSRLIIHDLQGVEIKTFEINQKGQSGLTIIGSELKAGMYLYTLLVDNKIIDTKRMILSK